MSTELGAPNKMLRGRVLHVVGGLDHGGVEKWLLQAARGLHDHGYRSDVLVSSRTTGAYERDIVALGSSVIRAAPPTSVIPFLLDFRRVLREHGPYNAVHSHVWLASGIVLLAAFVFGVPVRIAHSRTARDPFRGGIVRRGYAALMRCLMARCATHLAGISDEAGAMLFGRRRWTKHGMLIPTAIDCSEFELTVDRHTVRNDLGLPLESCVIGHVGNLREPKNHRLLLRVFREILTEIPDAALLLVGDGPLREELHALAGKLAIADRVYFVGPRSDVARLMLGAMDVFVFPSIWEGMGRAVVEAQAAGLPCVISDRIPNAAVVVDDLVERVPLSAPPHAWATRIVETYRRERMSRTTALRAVQASDMSMSSLIPTLVMLYDGTDCPSGSSLQPAHDSEYR